MSTVNSSPEPIPPNLTEEEVASLHQPPEEKIQRSLFGEILDWMLAPLLLLWPVSIAITYLVAKSIANQPFDRALEDRVMVLSQQVKEVADKNNIKTVTQLNNSARDILRADDLDTIYFQVKEVTGELLDGDKELPMPNEDEKPTAGGITMRNVTLHGVDMRVAFGYIDIGKKEPHLPHLVLIQVGETMEKRSALANEIIKGVILPQFIILPIALALIWFALSRGLLPLKELQHRIRARKPDDLSPIDSLQVPEEISPLVTSLNDMLERLSQTIQTQKRFIADAAHQMKTPLAGMRMQSELALRQTNQEEIHRSLTQLSKSSEAATRLVNQLLALARAENLASATQAFAPIDLVELARETVQEWLPASFAQRIDLGLEAPEQTVLVLGNAIMLREMLNNLIDNALRYTAKESNVTVRLAINTEEHLTQLEVEDNGNGIPSNEREKVFNRFYRILGSNVPGSGLGLAIVREIVQQHGAQIEILDNPQPQNPQYKGCLIRIIFPSLSAANEVTHVE